MKFPAFEQWSFSVVFAKSPAISWFLIFYIFLIQGLQGSLFVLVKKMFFSLFKKINRQALNWRHMHVKETKQWNFSNNISLLN